MAVESIKKEKVSQPTQDEVLTALKAQYEEHKTMMIKAQGAIEVLEQMKAGISKEK